MLTEMLGCIKTDAWFEFYPALVLRCKSTMVILNFSMHIPENEPERTRETKLELVNIRFGRRMSLCSFSGQILRHEGLKKEG